MKVLVADDDPLLRKLLPDLLNRFGHTCATVGDGETAWEHLQGGGTDVVISDWQMPGLNGVELCRRVRATPEITYPYFILLTVRAEHDDVLTAVRAGVDDYLTKPLDLAALESRLIVAERVRNLQIEMLTTRLALEDANAQLDKAAHQDALTGLGNRFSLNRDLPGIEARFIREGFLYNIGLFDIDHFKSYNDTYGHQQGDALLQEVGRVLAAELRQGDRAYRYGGEEFLVVLPNRSVANAARGVERIRNRVAKSTGVSTLAQVSMSAGIAGAVEGDGIERVIERADRALYEAKRSGRDRMVIDHREM